MKIRKKLLKNIFIQHFLALIVAICSFLFKTLKSLRYLFNSEADNEHGPSILKLISTEMASSSLNSNLIFFRFNTISHTSSEIPFIVVNSCEIPSILTEVIAAPGKDVSKVLLSPLPIVTA